MPIVVIGAGGFGRETIDVLEAMNLAGPSPAWELLGVVDANPSQLNLIRLAERGVAYLGREDAWLRSGNRAHYLIAIGSPQVRARIDSAWRDAGLTAAAVVHPMATLGSHVTVGHGSVICAGVQVSTNVTLGRHVHLNPNATIGHDTILGDFVSVNPAAVVSGDVVVGTASLVGAGAVILQGLAVGENSVIGASACVTRDVGMSVTVKGVPARESGVK